MAAAPPHDVQEPLIGRTRPASYSVLVYDLVGDRLEQPAIAAGPRAAAEDLLATLAQSGVPAPRVDPADAEGVRLRWTSPGALTEVVITAGLTYELYHRPEGHLMGAHKITGDSRTASALLLRRLPRYQRQDAVTSNEHAATSRQLLRMAEDLRDQELALSAAAGGPDWVRQWLIERAEALGDPEAGM